MSTFVANTIGYDAIGKRARTGQGHIATRAGPPVPSQTAQPGPSGARLLRLSRPARSNRAGQLDARSPTFGTASWSYVDRLVPVRWAGRVAPLVASPRRRCPFCRNGREAIVGGKVRWRRRPRAANRLPPIARFGVARDGHSVPSASRPRRRPLCEKCRSARRLPTFTAGRCSARATPSAGIVVSRRFAAGRLCMGVQGEAAGPSPGLCGRRPPDDGPSE